MEFDIRYFGGTSQGAQSWNGEIGLDGQAENDVRESHLAQQSIRCFLGIGEARSPVLTSRSKFLQATEFLDQETESAGSKHHTATFTC